MVLLLLPHKYLLHLTKSRTVTSSSSAASSCSCIFSCPLLPALATRPPRPPCPLPLLPTLPAPLVPFAPSAPASCFWLRLPLPLAPALPCVPCLPLPFSCLVRWPPLAIPLGANCSSPWIPSPWSSHCAPSGKCCCCCCCCLTSGFALTMRSTAVSPTYFCKHTCKQSRDG
ncbi:hypothetical protein DUNSADRAFT_5980 [Dunaliella salina]|uniref:Uncharacterized protein n=1 Tax=Dunaliella salina TaxID=3046 RepID=A0ABQ7GP91_DUNSA|nr:hypothetical protein DUNSADRAFT_5980 [Dunaliella salina]|eukprot:KAF5836410.1 hypothetical protein DUNSADRAFT_5980 [Dunaliella salina]